MSAISIANGVSALLMEIEVQMTGVNNITSAIATIARTLDNLTDQQIAALNAAFTIVAATAAATFAIIKEGLDQLAETEDIEARLKSFAGSYKVAANQMELINRLALDGVFSRSEWGQAVILMDEANLSISKNLTLLENLGARLHSVGNAAKLLEKIEGAGPGPVRRIMDQLREAGITPEILAQHGVKVAGQNVLSGKESLMRALREIAESDTAYGDLANNLGAKGAIMGESFHRLVQAIVTPLAPFIGFLMDTISGLMQGLTRFQKAYHMVSPGIAAIAVVIAVVLRIVSFFVNIIATIGELLQGIGTKIGNYLQPTLEKLQSIFQPVINFFTWLYDWFKKIFDFLEGRKTPGLAGPKDVDKPGSHADKPIRHDDVENMYKRLHGWGWTG